MRILVLGGTSFLSRETARRAVAAGHDVTCACRGESGPLPDGVTHVRWDRSDEAPAEITDGQWDAVIDVARLPSHVRRALDAATAPHWVFVSTINVYARDDVPGTPATLELRAPQPEDVDLATDPEAYGPMKVACEQAVSGAASSAAIVRPGLIVGPEDGSGRFAYWPDRLADIEPGEAVLAPGRPADSAQVVDVRDLAEWLAHLATHRIAGVFDAVGEVLPLGDLLAAVAAGVDADPSWVWVSQEDLQELGVQPWMGPGSLPLWLPRPDYDGLMHHDPTPALEAGLVLRPVAQTASDTLLWLRSAPEARIIGLSRERETEVLDVVARRG